MTLAYSIVIVNTTITRRSSHLGKEADSYTNDQESNGCSEKNNLKKEQSTVRTT